MHCIIHNIPLEENPETSDSPAFWGTCPQCDDEQILLEYQYITLPFLFVLHQTERETMHFPDAYIAQDKNTQMYRQVLAAGFRWIRTEEETAIFERIVCTQTGEINPH